MQRLEIPARPSRQAVKPSDRAIDGTAHEIGLRACEIRVGSGEAHGSPNAPRGIRTTTAPGLAEYDTVFVRVARQFEDLCRLAGFDDLAAKVRPSVRRRGETEVRPGDGEVPDAAQGAGADSAAPAEGASASPAEPEPAGEPDSETGAEPVGEPKSETGTEPASAAAS